jgi:hypothetical protein
MDNRLLLQSALLVVTGLVMEPLFAAPPVRIGQGETVCCVGNNGHVCGDIPPADCSGKALKVYNRQGLHVRTIAAPMTAEERAIAAAAAKKAKEDQEAIQMQRRHDQALLQTYNSLADIDRVQKNTENNINADIKHTLERISEARQRKQELDQQAGFYTGKDMPPALLQAIRDQDLELRVQQEALEMRRKDLEAAQSRYDADRKRYNELTQQQ